MEEVPWSRLREEARALAAGVGQAGRQHHSLLRDGAALAAVRARGVPSEHRAWAWPLLLLEQGLRLRRQAADAGDVDGAGASYRQLLGGTGAALEESEDAAADAVANAVADTPSRSLEQAQESAMERFEHMNPFQERKINRILVAYAKSRRAFVYSHGMVEVCVVLSTFLDEEDAFWAFRLLLDALLPKYYDESLADFHMDCLVLQELLQAADAALQDHLAVLGVSVQLLGTKWFYSLFAEAMPFELVCRLFDILLADICGLRLNAKVILSTSLAVLLYLSSTLVEIHDPSVVLEVINEFCFTTLSDYSIADSFVDLILFVHDRIEDEQLAALRTKYREQLAREDEQRRSLQKGMPLRRRKSSAARKQQLEHRKNRMQSIKLLIQWRKHVGDGGNDLDDECDGGRRGDVDGLFETRDASTLSQVNERRDSVGDERKPPPDSSARKQSGGSEEYEYDGGGGSKDYDTEEGEEEDDRESEDDAAVVTTPSEKEMLARVYQGISKINRRRSRSSAAFRGNDRPLSRTFSLTSSLLQSTPRGIREDDSFESVADSSQGAGGDNTAAVWQRLKAGRAAGEVVRHSMSGIPDEHRVWAWPILISQLPRPSNLPRLPTAGARSSEDADMLLDREIAKSIDNDISRTRNLRGDQASQMRRVLTAFALRNRRVGYCQGMNEILAVLLQYLSEDQALVALVLLIEVLLPAYHVDSMIGLHTDCAVMDTLLQQNDKDLHAHLNEVGLNMEILCTKWLVTCFLTSLPPFCGLKVVDMLLARASEKQCASRVLLGVGISIFFTLRATLLDAKDAGEVLLAINEYFAEEMTKTDAQMGQFLRFCEAIIQQLEPSIVEELRQVHKDEVMDRFAAFEAKKIEMRQQLEEAKSRQRKSVSAPSSPSKPDVFTRSSIFSSVTSHASGSGKSGQRRSVLSAYIGSQLRGAPKAAAAFAANSGGANDDKESRGASKFYQRIDVLEVNRSFSEELLKMEDQLDDLADLYLRGKIDEKEHSCIRAQIVRKWCKGMNSPQSAMMRMRSVKNLYAASSRSLDGGRASTGSVATVTISSASAASAGRGPMHDGLPRRSLSNAEPLGAHAKKGGNSLYGRMKKAQKSAMAMIKSTFE